MRVLFIGILLVLQQYAPAQEKKPFHPVISLRANPLSWAEADAGFMLGLGYQFLPRWSVNIDPMIIFYSPYKISRQQPGETEPVNGYKIRGSLNYYFRDFIYGGRGGFIAIEFHYKMTSTRQWDSFGINCTNGQCDYFQRAPYNEKKQEEGIAVKAGLIRRLWSPRWAIELYSGLGFKYKHFENTGLPAGANFPDTPVDQLQFGSFRDDGLYPIFPTGVKFIYRCCY